MRVKETAVAPLAPLLNPHGVIYGEGNQEQATLWSMWNEEDQDGATPPLRSKRGGWYDSDHSTRTGVKERGASPSGEEST